MNAREEDKLAKTMQTLVRRYSMRKKPSSMLIDLVSASAGEQSPIAVASQAVRQFYDKSSLYECLSKANYSQIFSGFHDLNRIEVHKHVPNRNFQIRPLGHPKKVMSFQSSGDK